MIEITFTVTSLVFLIAFTRNKFEFNKITLSCLILLLVLVGKLSIQNTMTVLIAFIGTLSLITTPTKYLSKVVLATLLLPTLMYLNGLAEMVTSVIVFIHTILFIMAIKKLKKILFLSILVYGLFTAFFNTSYADDPTNYYKKYFESIGYITDTKYGNESTFSLNVYLASDLKNNNELSGNFKVIVCNEFYKFQNIKCDQSKIYGDINSNNIGNISDKLQIAFEQNSNIFLIPEVLFTTPSSNEKLKNYFVDLKNSSINYENSKNVIKVGNIKNSNILIKYLFSIGLIGILINLVIQLIKQTKLYIEQVNNNGKTIDIFLDVKTKAEKLSILVYTTTIILGFVFIGTSLIISLKDKGQVSFSYIYIYFKSSLSQLSNFCSDCSYINTIYLIITAILLLFSILSFLLLTFKNKKHIRLDIKLKNSELYLIRYLITASACISIALLILLNDITKIYIVFVGILAITIAAKILNANNFKIKNIKADFLVVAFCIFLTVLINKNVENKSKGIKIVNSNKETIFLPQKGFYENNNFFIKLNTTGIYANIFIDNYLIKSKEKNNIKNLNILELKDKTGMLVSTNLDDTISFIAKYPDKLSYLYSTKVNYIKYLSYRVNEEKENIRIVFDVDCNVERPSSDLNGNISSRELYGPEKISMVFLKFPGCKGNEGIKRFISEEALPISKTMYIELDYKKFKDIGIQNWEIESPEILEQQYLIANSIDDTPIIAQLNKRIQDEDTIYVYSIGITKNMEFKNDNDISKAINRLKNEDLLNNPFKLWSDTPYLRLKL